MSNKIVDKNDPDIADVPVFCIEISCNKVVMIKDSIIGNEPGDFYCSELCRQKDLLAEGSR